MALIAVPKLVLNAWDSVIQASLEWSADVLARFAGRLTLADYQRIRDELVAGMRRAGATEEQITAALREFEGQVKSVGGTVVQNPPLAFSDLSGSLFWLLAIGIVTAIIAEYSIRHLERGT